MFQKCLLGKVIYLPIDKQEEGWGEPRTGWLFISGRDIFHLYPLALLGEPEKYFSYFAELQEHFSEYKLAEWFHISYVQNFCQA